MSEMTRSTRAVMSATLPALAVVSAAAALGFDRVFDDGAYVAPLLGAALAPHAIGYLLRRRTGSSTLATITSLVALALSMTWYAARDTTFSGLPTTATPEALGQVLGDGVQILRHGIAPVPADVGAVLLAFTLVWVMATVADALVFSADASIGGIVPSLVVFVIASSLGSTGTWIWAVVPYVAAAIWFLSSCHSDVLTRHRSWFSAPAERSRRATVTAAGLGATAVIAGLVLTPFLSGSSDSPLLDFRANGGVGGYQSSQNPLVDIKARLTRDVDTELFTVASPARLYWRQVALDQFDGTEWTISSTSRAAREVLDGAGGAPTIAQNFTLTGLYERWLPAAYEPVGISLSDTRVVPESSTLVHADDNVGDLSYRVQSLVRPPTPTPAEIAGTDRELAVSLRPYTELPDDLPAVVGETAFEIAAGAATPYEQADALERFFTDGSFAYDLDVPAASGSEAIGQFLKGRRGFCQQFAGTFGAMARALGLPTRIAVGFTPGDFDADAGVYRVTGRNAHSWPEVWFAGLGWTSFEPTPAGPQPGAADPTPEEDPEAVAGVPGTPNTTRAPVPPPTPPPGDGGGPIAAAPTDPAGTRTGLGRLGLDRTGLTLVVGATGVIVVVGFAAWRLNGARLRRRRRAARRNGPTRTAVIAAWREALSVLAGHGAELTAAQTPREVLADLDTTTDLAPVIDAPLARMADATTAALWAETAPRAEVVARVWTDLDLVTQAVDDRAPRWVRLRLLVFG